MISQMKLQLIKRTVIGNFHIGTSSHMPIVIVAVLILCNLSDSSAGVRNI
jgi:hypothetical protein